MLAAVSVCVVTGLFGGLLVYFGQLVWPNYHTYSNVETAFIEVTGRVGGLWLFQAMAILLVIANIGAGMGSYYLSANVVWPALLRRSGSNRCAHRSD